MREVDEMRSDLEKLQRWVDARKAKGVAEDDPVLARAIGRKVELERALGVVERLRGVFDKQSRLFKAVSAELTQLSDDHKSIEQERDRLMKIFSEAPEAHEVFPTPDSLIAHDAEVIERALSDEKVREAMQLIWNDHTSDTGCFPDDFSIDDDGLLYFTAGHYFADRVANQLRQQAKEVQS